MHTMVNHSCLSSKPWTHLVDNFCLYETCFCLEKCSSCYLFLAKEEKMLVVPHNKKNYFLSEGLKQKWKFFSIGWKEKASWSQQSAPFKQTCFWSRLTSLQHNLWPVSSKVHQIQNIFNSKPFDIMSLLHSRLSMSHGLADLILKSHWPWKRRHSCPQHKTLIWKSNFVFYLEAVFELLGHKVEDYGIDAGVDFCHVDSEEVQN